MAVVEGEVTIIQTNNQSQEIITKLPGQKLECRMKKVTFKAYTTKALTKVKMPGMADKMVTIIQM